MNGTHRSASRPCARLGMSLATSARASHAQIAPPLTTLHSFSALSSTLPYENTDGAKPQAALIQAKDGNLYGTCAEGGAYGSGTVFKITPSGVLTILHSFSGPDGAKPQAALIQAKDGNLYGTTANGGANGGGTVFKITTSGTLTSLYTFSSRVGYGNSDGALPFASLIQGADGNLYGACYAGGASGYGTVFKITTSGVMTTLYNFTGGFDGAQPRAGLIQSTDGNLYGTCWSGGAYGAGVVFTITTSGALTNLYSFTGSGSDGATPAGGLIQGTDGNLYGTCSYGGTNEFGTVFQVTTAGDLTPLYSFNGPDGDEPYATLIQGKDGNLYGTCRQVGASNNGTVFKITTAGDLTTLHYFSRADGADPQAGLIQGKDGNLYGTTADGGATSDGTVFKLTMIPVITSFSPTSGPVETSVTLTGVNFTGTTSVKIGTVAASFILHSDTSLTLIVPTGAVTGNISVVNGFGAGVSAKNFTVTP